MAGHKSCICVVSGTAPSQRIILLIVSLSTSPKRTHQPSIFSPHGENDVSRWYEQYTDTRTPQSDRRTSNGVKSHAMLEAAHRSSSSSGASLLCVGSDLRSVGARVTQQLSPLITRAASPQQGSAVAQLPLPKLEWKASVLFGVKGGHGVNVEKSKKVKD